MIQPKSRLKTVYLHMSLTRVQKKPKMLSPTIGEDEFNTPTISEEVPESLSFIYSSLNEKVGVAASPWKEGTLIIRDPKTKLVFALKEDALGLLMASINMVEEATGTALRPIICGLGSTMRLVVDEGKTGTAWELIMHS